jgi:hypothetical protein
MARTTFRTFLAITMVVAVVTLFLWASANDLRNLAAADLASASDLGKSALQHHRAKFATLRPARFSAKQAPGRNALRGADRAAATSQRPLHVQSEAQVAPVGAQQLLMTSRWGASGELSSFAKAVVGVMVDIDTKRFAKALPTGALVYARRFRVFGVGWAKSGTSSLAQLLGSPSNGQGMHRVRAHVQHEPGLATLSANFAKAMEGDAKRRAAGERVPTMEHMDQVRVLTEQLRAREQSMGRLEGDISFMNAPVAPLLARMFPRAKFIATIRDPISHIGSMVRYYEAMASGAMGPVWKKSWDMLGKWLNGNFIGPVPTLEGMPDQERALKVEFPSAWTTEQLLVLWCDHLTSLRAALPAERILFLRTHELSSPATVAQLSAFLGAPTESFASSRGHVHQTVRTADPLNLLPDAYFDATFRRVMAKDPKCAKEFTRFFPEPKFASLAAWKAARAKKTGKTSIVH